MRLKQRNAVCDCVKAMHLRHLLWGAGIMHTPNCWTMPEDLPADPDDIEMEIVTGRRQTARRHIEEYQR